MLLQDPRGFIAKLSDFGLSMKMAAHDGSVPGIKYGTVQYLAPEVLNTHIMTKKADVYSFGIIMWEVWHSRLFAEFYNNEKRKRKQCAAPPVGICAPPYHCSADHCRPRYRLFGKSVLMLELMQCSFVSLVVIQDAKQQFGHYSVGRKRHLRAVRGIRCIAGQGSQWKTTGLW